ncbi:MAG: DUF2513 domain-containing protein [Methanomicrobiales archaeon]|nr:DUF2513 domain-containing protein [Methanomicrobiales archaeon]
MKRDMDLVRKILLEIESLPGGFSNEPIKQQGYSDDEIDYHLTIMLEAGLIYGASHSRSGHYYPLIIPTRLTWQGHEFLDASRDEGRWVKAKEIFKDVGGVSFEIAKEVLVRLMMSSVTTVLTGAQPH